MIKIMPPINKLNPRSAFKENFSFRIRKENAIVNNIDNLVIEETAIGLTPGVFKA